MIIYFNLNGVDYQKIIDGQNEMDRLLNALDFLNKLKSRNANLELLGAV